MIKILIIEDDPLIREEIVLWLSLEGYEAIAAANGSEGITLATEQLPDLIICDIMMPEKDGYHVLLQLRTQPPTALIPFIFLSAKQEKVEIRYGMELGADDYLTKPFDRKEFLGAISARLERHKLYIQDSTMKIDDLRRDLLHTLPHELRTPLIGILGIGELLVQDAETITPGEITDYGTMITSSGRQLSRLVENYLLYVQLERYATDPTQATLNDQVVEVNKVISEASERVATAYSRLPDLQISVLSGVVRISRQNLAKIIHELVDNAFKFSQTHEHVQVMGHQQGTTYLIAITNQGCGIAPENIARIGAYMQFERATYEQQGIGLGLAIVRRIVDLAKGDLQIESTIGAGTTVRVVLQLDSTTTADNPT